MWCEDEAIKPYFIKAGKNLTYGDLKRQLSDSLEDKPFPELSEALQRNTFWEFGSKEVRKNISNTEMPLCRHIHMEIFRSSMVLTICSIRFAIQRDSQKCWRRSLRQGRYNR